MVTYEQYRKLIYKARFLQMQAKQVVSPVGTPESWGKASPEARQEVVDAVQDIIKRLSPGYVCEHHFFYTPFWEQEYGESFVEILDGVGTTHKADMTIAPFVTAPDWWPKDVSLLDGARQMVMRGEWFECCLLPYTVRITLDIPQTSMEDAW